MISLPSRRTVTVKGRRTSISLEGSVWDALYDICGRENLALSELLTLVADHRSHGALASALRVFSLFYFRAASEAPDAAPKPGERLAPGPDGYSAFMAEVLYRFAERSGEAWAADQATGNPPQQH